MPASQTKKRGVRRAVISAKLTPAAVAGVDKFAARTKTTRSAAVAVLVDVGLENAVEVERLLTENAKLRETIVKARAVLR